MGVGHAVYMTMDSRAHMCRWIRPVDHFGFAVEGSPHNPSQPACKHEDIHYLSQYWGKSKEYIDSVVGAQLRLPPALVIYNGDDGTAVEEV